MLNGGTSRSWQKKYYKSRSWKITTNLNLEEMPIQSWTGKSRQCGVGNVQNKLKNVCECDVG